MSIENGKFNINEVDVKVINLIKTKLVDKHPCLSDFVLPAENSEISRFETNLNLIKTENSFLSGEKRTNLILGVLDLTLSMNLFDYQLRHKVNSSAIQLLKENHLLA